MTYAYYLSVLSYYIFTLCNFRKTTFEFIVNYFYVTSYILCINVHSVCVITNDHHHKNFLMVCFMSSATEAFRSAEMQYVCVCVCVRVRAYVRACTCVRV
jgi:hypothetical protein